MQDASATDQKASAGKGRRRSWQLLAPGSTCHLGGGANRTESLQLHDAWRRRLHAALLYYGLLCVTMQ